MAGKEPPALNRRTVLGAGVAALAGQGLVSAQPGTFSYGGRLSQGGALIGRAAPRAMIAVNGRTEGQASARGYFVVGFDRDEPAMAVIGAGASERGFAIAPVDYDVQRIDGLAQDQVTPTAPALLERIAREAKLKAAGFASVDDGEGFAQGFVWPVRATRISARFGGQRVLNGEAQRPHYGIDLAAPVGAQIIAPADGLVVLAEPDLHYEGGLTLIDHGQGLVAAYLHQSRQLVRAGERVVGGQPIGAVGQTGRATGPHLCWRLKWRGHNLDPSLMIGAAAPVA